MKESKESQPSEKNKIQGEQKPTPIQGEQKPTPIQEEQKPTQVQEEQKPTPIQEEQKSTSVQETKKTPPVSEKSKGNERILTILGIILAFAGVCVAILACIITISVPEVRKLVGLKDEPNQIEVVVPTEIIQPTPTNGPCVDILDVRFVSDTIFTKDSLSELYPAPPKGEYMILATEYTNMQSQPMKFRWEEVFKIAGQSNTSNNDWTYYFPNWDITWGYYDEHFSESLTGENCYETSNPGLWNRCYMVFDIDPAATNLHLVLYNFFYEDGTPFNNACKSTWKIPEGNR